MSGGRSFLLILVQVLKKGPLMRAESSFRRPGRCGELMATEN